MDDDSQRPTSSIVLPVLLMLFAFINLATANATVNPRSGALIPGGLKALSVAIAIVQGASGLLLLYRQEAGRWIFLIGMPLLILGLASYSLQGLTAFVGYALFAFFLTRPTLSGWLRAGSRRQQTSEGERGGPPGESDSSRSRRVQRTCHRCGSVVSGELRPGFDAKEIICSCGATVALLRRDVAE